MKKGLDFVINELKGGLDSRHSWLDSGLDGGGLTLLQ